MERQRGRSVRICLPCLADAASIDQLVDPDQALTDAPSWSQSDTTPSPTAAL